uniref:Uncharacterized protein n=1 Tax=Anguilla anguilla TaxID=7936 RepID=A0A0E9WI26_ANGAN
MSCNRSQRVLCAGHPKIYLVPLPGEIKRRQNHKEQKDNWKTRKAQRRAEIRGTTAVKTGFMQLGGGEIRRDPGYFRRLYGQVDTGDWMNLKKGGTGPIGR